MIKPLAGIGLALTLAALPASAGEFDKQVKARKSLMQVYAFNIGLLGGMAKGEMPYDAEIASAAADNLYAAVSMKNSMMWPKGSDNVALGDMTRAKPEAWSEYPKVAEKSKAMQEAAARMSSVAGNGLDAVQGNMKSLGEGCKGCHKIARAPKKKKK